MSAPQPACSVADVPEGTATRVVLDGVPIAVVHTEGQWFAVSDVCSHADVSLAEGDVDGCTLECWLHGSRFDLRTGQPSGPPAVKSVPVYPVYVEGDTVFVAVA
jgi:3-phenylpropionate/trans-cinnamate dioxygenase ferredoxin subunit